MAGPQKPLDEVTRRAAELAMIHGRPPTQQTETDRIWAQRELKPMDLSRQLLPEEKAQSKKDA